MPPIRRHGGSPKVTAFGNPPANRMRGLAATLSPGLARIALPHLIHPAMAEL